METATSHALVRSDKYNVDPYKSLRLLRLSKTPDGIDVRKFSLSILQQQQEQAKTRE